MRNQDPAARRDGQAVDILRANDRGGYTVPTARLYPYQWNWDSAFVALGLAEFDAARAWTELEMLFAGQWPNGMVPHIIFRADDPDYFPGPGVWRSGTTPPSSGISQPPVAATIVRALLDKGPRELAERKARALFAKLLAWHRWFHDFRDPGRLGVIAVTHPWESGRDNSPDWDGPMAAVDTAGVGTFTRRDTGHVDAAMRPTKEDYERYIAIVQFGAAQAWDPVEIARSGPFFVADPGVTFVLLRADRDLLALAEELGFEDAKAEIAGWIDRALEGAGRLWNEELGGYCARDLRRDRLADGLSSTAFLGFYAGLDDGARAGRLLDNLERILGAVRYGVPSFDPHHPRFDRLRYWRGPVWCMINYMIGLGLREHGHDAPARRVRDDTTALIEAAGFNECYCPHSGQRTGGADFAWTAAIWLAWASPAKAGPAPQSQD